MALAFESLARLSALAFVAANALSLGLGLTPLQVLGPLRDRRLVGRALLANLFVVPAVGAALLSLVALPDSVAVGLALLAVAAGAPALPRLVATARGDVAFGVAVAVLSTVLTVALLPLLLPLVGPAVDLNAVPVTITLLAVVAAPLGAGLLVRARYPRLADAVSPIVEHASRTALVVLVLLVGLSLDSIRAVVDARMVLVTLLLVAGAAGAGYLLAGAGAGTRAATTLGTAQRNVPVALAVSVRAFEDPSVFVTVLAGGTLMAGVVAVVGGELGRRAAPTKATYRGRPLSGDGSGREGQT